MFNLFEEKPGLFIGLQTYFPHEIIKRIVEMDARKTMIVHGKTIKSRSTLLKHV